MDYPFMTLIALTLLTLLVASAYYIRYHVMLKVQAKRTAAIVCRLAELQLALSYARALDDPKDFLRAWDTDAIRQERWRAWRRHRDTGIARILKDRRALV